MDFEYFDPKPDDFHGVKALLRTYLDDEVWDVSAFTDLVLAQTTVGTVVKAGEDDSPIGLLTCLNLGRYQVRILRTITQRMSLRTFSSLRSSRSHFLSETGSRRSRRGPLVC